MLLQNLKEYLIKTQGDTPESLKNNGVKGVSKYFHSDLIVTTLD